MSEPLVTVVCMCYNHEKYIEEAVNSVLDQTYHNIQIIIVDDGSIDSSAQKLKALDTKNRKVEFLLLENNVGYCRAFNKSMPSIRGEYFIDFATDDVMMPDRIEKQVQKFQSLDGSYGVVFSDAIYIDESGFELRHHYDYMFRKGLLKTIPQGYIYKDLLARYFIAAPTMLVRTQVIQDLKGYDENLSFEDFDFWVRSSIRYQYAFVDEKLTKIRKSQRSMSTGLYEAGNKQLHSTYVVCKKAQVLNRSEVEKNALLKRVRYELRHSALTSNSVEAALFFNLVNDLSHANTLDKIWLLLSKSKIPLKRLRKLYHQVRY